MGRKRRNTVPNMTLSLLDMLFSTFGGIILLAILFSAVIRERAAIQSNNFYHASVTIEISNLQNSLESYRKLEAPTLRFTEVMTHVQNVNQKAWLNFSENALNSKKNSQLTAITQNPKALSVFMAQEVSGNETLVETINVAYSFEQGELDPDLAFTLIYLDGFPYCKNEQDQTVIKVFVQEQFGDTYHINHPIQFDCQQMVGLGYLINIVPPDICQFNVPTNTSCPRPIKRRP